MATIHDSVLVCTKFREKGQPFRPSPFKRSKFYKNWLLLSELCNDLPVDCPQFIRSFADEQKRDAITFFGSQ